MSHELLICTYYCLASPNYWKTARDTGHLNGIRIMAYTGYWAPNFYGTTMGQMDIAHLLPVLDQAVAIANSLGMYVAIDNHSACCTGQNLSTDTALWQAVAPSYANDSNVIYEVKNEPDQPANPASYVSYETSIYHTMRSAAPSTHIILWSPTDPVGVSSNPLQYFSPGMFNDPNASFGFHAYGQSGNIPKFEQVITTFKQNYPVISTELDVDVTAGQGDPNVLFKWYESQGISWMLLGADRIYGGVSGSNAMGHSVTWPLDPGTVAPGTTVTPPVTGSCTPTPTPPPGPPTPITISLPAPISFLQPVLPSGTPSDTSPPFVSLSSPSYYATVSGTVSISADAIDDSGIARVDFWVNGTKVSSSPSAPYSYLWDTTKWPDGVYLIMAVAYDLSGNHTASSPVLVTVQNGSASNPSPTPTPAPTPTPSPSSFPLGSTIQTTTLLNVRSSPALTLSNSVGTQSSGSIGTVLSGPIASSGYDWYQVNFATGIDGYVAGSYIVRSTQTPTPSPSPTPPPGFSIGSAVHTTTKVNVRSSGSLSASILSTESSGATGTITAGPVVSGYTWWKVTYANGVSGWSAGSLLR